MEHTFTKPRGLGSGVELILVMFAETACCVAVAFGFLWRLSIIPILIDLVVLVFVVTAHATFGNKELPLLYLVVYIILYFTGPGKYSIDGWIEKRSYRDKK